MRKLINLFIAKISQVSRNDKEKDLLSIAYITWFVLYFFLIMIPLFIESLVFIFRKVIGVNFDAYYLSVSSEEISLNIFDFYVFSINDIFKIFLVGLIPVISRIFFKRSSFKHELVVIVVSILGIVIIFNNYILSLIIFLSFILIICVVPLGKGKYINFIINIKYLKEVGENYLHKNNEVLNKEIYTKVVCKCVKISVLIVLIACLLSYYMSMPFIFMLIIVISLVCLLYLYRETKDEIMTVLKKIIVFVVFLFISLYANRIVPNNLEKILLLVTTVYFSFDRVISLGKDIQDIIKKHSVRYYYENEFLSIKDIQDEYLEMKFIDSFEIDEDELIKQIILRDKVCFLCELHQLCKLYQQKNFGSYRQLVEFYLYIINTAPKEEIDLNDREIVLENILEIQNQKLFPIELYKEYATVLYAQQKFNKAIGVYEEFLLYLDKDELYNMYHCYKELGKDKKAGKLKQYYIDTK